MNSRASQFLLPAIAITILAGGLAQSWRIASNNSGIDFFHIWSVPVLTQQLDVPADAIYDKDRHAEWLRALRDAGEPDSSSQFQQWLDENQVLYEDGFHPTGTPFFYQANPVVSGFWAGQPPAVACQRFQVSSTLLFVVGCTCLGVAFGLKWTWSLVLAGGFLLLHQGLHADIGVANVNRIQCGLFSITVSVFVWLTRRTPTVGLLLLATVAGLLTMYKPNAALIGAIPLLALLTDKRWRWSIGYGIGWLAGLLAGFLTGALEKSLATWQAWQGYVSSIATDPFPIEAGNYGLPLLFAGDQVRMVSLALTTILLFLTVLGILKTRHRSSRACFLPLRYGILAGAGWIIPLLSGPVVWGHYLALSIPASIMAFAVAMRLETGRLKQWLLTLLASGWFLSGVVPVALIPGVTESLLLVSIQAGLACLLAASLGALSGIQSLQPADPLEPE